MKIVLYPAVREDLLDLVKQTAPDAEVVMPSAEEASEEMADAEILFAAIAPEMLQVMLQAARQLRWVQSTSAGMERELRLDEVREGTFILTNSSGLHAVQVAEHAWALAASLCRGIPASLANQRHKKWGGRGFVDLYGATAGILGFGGIGREIAKRAQAFGMRILAADVQGGDRPFYVEALLPVEGLDEILRESDVLFIACPHTPQTEKLIGQHAFEIMKSTAFLVNPARGPIVDEAALVSALQSGQIAGAGLDVFEVEPLPESSPLWEMENVIVTSHRAGGSAHRPRRTVEFFCENLRRYLSGEGLLNEVDRTLGYPSLEKRAGIRS